MVLGWPVTQQARQLSHACVLLAVAQFLRYTLELGVVLSLEQDKGALWGHMFQGVTLGWLLALWPSPHLSCGQWFLSPRCFLSERLCGKHMWLGPARLVVVGTAV